MNSIQLPEWTRWSWRTVGDREIWNPVRVGFTATWPSIERWSVVDGIRSVTLQTVDAHEMVSLNTWAGSHGLIVVPVAQTSNRAQYSNRTPDMRPGDSWSYRVAIGKPEHAMPFVSAYHASDDATMGALLGYPTCCTDLFLRTWKIGQADSTWEQSLAGASPDGPPEANLLLRWMGVRLVSHLPCSFTCPHTVSLGKQFAQCARDHAIEIDSVYDMLNWGVQWSRLHGIAEIVTDRVRISCNTDWTADKQSFTRRENGTRRRILNITPIT